MPFIYSASCLPICYPESILLVLDTSSSDLSMTSLPLPRVIICLALSQYDAVGWSNIYPCYEANIFLTFNTSKIVRCRILTAIIDYSNFRTTGPTSTCPQTEVHDHPISLGVRCGQISISPTVVGFLDCDYC